MIGSNCTPAQIITISWPTFLCHHLQSCCHLALCNLCCWEKTIK